MYTQRQYPLFSACGLNCGLCPRFHTDGKSRCPGCAGAGFLEKHPTCGVLSCCQKRSLEVCFECGDFPCAKYDGAGDTDSFISHKNEMADLAKAKAIGMAAYQSELDEKVSALQVLLAGYDDGRRKSFFCTAAQLLPLRDIQSVMLQLSENADASAALKDKVANAVRLLQSAADASGIEIGLRKKQGAAKRANTKEVNGNGQA